MHKYMCHAPGLLHLLQAGEQESSGAGGISHLLCSAWLLDNQPSVSLIVSPLGPLGLADITLIWPPLVYEILQRFFKKVNR